MAAPGGGEPTPGPPSLRQRVVSGTVWNAGGKIATTAIQMASTVILARLLTPTDFGLFAMTLLFVGFAAFLGNWGIANVIIQRRELTQTHLATAFWMNQFVSACITVALWLCAPLVADFFGEPDLVGLVRMVALSVSLQMAVVPIALLEREFRFRAIAVIETTSLTLGLVAAVLAAVAGLGAASLAIQSMTLTASWSITSFVTTRWLPTARPSRGAFRDLFSISGWLAVGNIVGYWSDNADTLGLGRTAPPDQVGFYNRAYNLFLLPVQSMVNVLARVIIPALARMQDNVERTRAAWLRSAAMVAAATFATCVGMAAVAPALVLTLWGDRWAPVIPLLQVLALAGMPWTIALACDWVLLARGRGRRYFMLKMASTTVTIAAVAIGLRWGALGVALAMLIRSWVVLPVYLVGSLREIDISLVDVAVNLWRPFCSAVGMGVLVAAVGSLMTGIPSAGTLTVQVMLGVGLYVGMLSLLDRALVREAFSLVWRRGQAADTEALADAVVPAPGPEVWSEVEQEFRSESERTRRRESDS